MERFRDKYPLRTTRDISIKMANDDAEGTIAKDGSITGPVGYFDIETTDLYSDKGYILCASIADDDLNVTTWRLDDYEGRSEPAMLIEMRDMIRDAFDYVVTWNGKYFDMPWVAYRLVRAKAGKFNGFRHIDAMNMVPRNAPSRSLDKVSRSLGVQDDAEEGDVFKTSYDEAIWAKAISGDREAMDYIVDHNRKDVLLLGRTFRAMRDRYGNRG
jgi:uncharacterized protein YprB with RNaseH-like and TPR domain